MAKRWRCVDLRGNSYPSQCSKIPNMKNLKKKPTMRNYGVGLREHRRTQRPSHIRDEPHLCNIVALSTQEHTDVIVPNTAGKKLLRKHAVRRPLNCRNVPFSLHHRCLFLRRLFKTGIDQLLIRRLNTSSLTCRSHLDLISRKRNYPHIFRKWSR